LQQLRLHPASSPEALALTIERINSCKIDGRSFVVTDKTDALVVYIRRNMGDLNIPMPGGEYEYSALPLCVTDAVFSLGVRYESTERTVREVCERYDWEMSRKQAPEERTISDFLRILQPYENRWEDMARDVFRNHQRTSSRSGILKSEAVYRVCKILRDHGAETFASFRRALDSGQCDDLRRAFTAVRGQGSGLSFNYLRILTGDTNAVKADRMVTRFVADAMRVRNVKPELCERLVREASAILRTEYPKLTPSLLDHAIWKYQRAQEETSQTACSRLPESKLGSNLGPNAAKLDLKPCTTT
jgi:hypothetical protein